MILNRTATLLWLFGVWILTSCALIPRQTLTSPFVDVTGTETNALDNSVMTPTSSAIIDNPNQVTDGKLRLSIREIADDLCYRPGDRIPLLLTYENLTSKSLEIKDYNIISAHTLIRSYGQLYPSLFTKENVRLLSREETLMITIPNPNPPISKIISANSRLDITVEYLLPDEFVVARQLDAEFQAVAPGRYYLKLAYAAIGFEDSWEGIISSNQIEICIMK